MFIFIDFLSLTMGAHTQPSPSAILPFFPLCSNLERALESSDLLWESAKLHLCFILGSLAQLLTIEQKGV